MRVNWSEHRWSRPRLLGATGALVLASLVSGLPAPMLAGAQSPPAPDFYWPYGIARVSGANLDPTAQTLVAFVRGKACGETTTMVATAGPNTPASDVGKTVYVVNIAASGTLPGQRPACGQSGDPVLFYLPQLHRTATQQPQFHQGTDRVDLDFDNRLQYQLRAPQVAIDP